MDISAMPFHTAMAYVFWGIVLLLMPLQCVRKRWVNRLFNVLFLMYLGIFAFHNYLVFGVHFTAERLLLSPDGSHYADGCEIDPVTLSLRDDPHFLRSSLMQSVMIFAVIFGVCLLAALCRSSRRARRSDKASGRLGGQRR